MAATSTRVGSGLSQQQENEIKFLHDFVTKHPEDADAFIRSYEIQPFKDPVEKAQQIVLIGTMVADPKAIDRRMNEVTTQRSLTGFGMIIDAIGGIFGEPEGGSKFGNFWRTLTGQPLPDRPLTEEEKAMVAAAIAAQEEEEKKKKEEEEKKKKQQEQWLIGGLVALVVIVLFLAIYFGTRQPKK